MRIRLLYLEVGSCNLEDSSIELITQNVDMVKRTNPVFRSQISNAIILHG